MKRVRETVANSTVAVSAASTAPASVFNLLETYDTDFSLHFLADALGWATAGDPDVLVYRFVSSAFSRAFLHSQYRRRVFGLLDDVWSGFVAVYDAFDPRPTKTGCLSFRPFPT